VANGSEGLNTTKTNEHPMDLNHNVKRATHGINNGRYGEVLIMGAIKHKVWDKINREWLIYKKHPVGWHCPLDKDSYLVDMWMYVSPDGVAFNELQHCIDSEHFEVVQYTGLKDKNGKEIFEGDIVGTGMRMGSDDYEVRFGWQGWEIHSENDMATFNLCQESSIIEIIGNVYENSDLLQAADQGGRLYGK